MNNLFVFEASCMRAAGTTIAQPYQSRAEKLGKREKTIYVNTESNWSCVESQYFFFLISIFFFFGIIVAIKFASFGFMSSFPGFFFFEATSVFYFELTLHSLNTILKVKWIRDMIKCIYENYLIKEWWDYLTKFVSTFWWSLNTVIVVSLTEVRSACRKCGGVISNVITE